MDFDFSLVPPRLKSLDQPQTVVDTLWFQCRRLTHENADLKEKLNTNSQNSSLPPSTTQSFKRNTPPMVQKKWWEKKPGAVIGHVGHGRQLLPLDQVHEMITCYPPTECMVCGSSIKALDTYFRKQICDLPQGKLHVTEYQLHHGRCTRFKQRCCASLPEGVSNKLLGHFALAKIGLITGKYHLSRRLVNTDRFGSYNWLSEDQHQYCWAHLIRDFRKISERENPKEGYVGCVLLSEAQSTIHYWNKLQTSEDEKIKIMCRSFLQDYPHRLKQTLEHGTILVGTKTSKFFRQVLKHWNCPCHFLNKPNVEPTNNAAEQALRQAVIWRKLSFGTQSKRGQLFVERMLSVIETCRQRDAPVLAFLESALVQSR